MTVRELSQLHNLKREIKELRMRLAELRAEAESISSPNLSGDVVMGGDQISRVERMVEQIALIEGKIQDRLDRCLVERQRLEDYIDTITDSQTRRIFMFRFVEDMSWAQVAFRLGGGISDSGVKMICYRFLKDETKKS